MRVVSVPSKGPQTRAPAKPMLRNAVTMSLFDSISCLTPLLMLKIGRAHV